jgi:hypothetical protein
LSDLTETQSSGSTKIVGSDASGAETTPIASTTLGEVRAVDTLTAGTGVQAALTVGTSSVEVKVGASPLVNRKMVTLFNNSGSILYWGFTSGVTIATGTPIFKSQQVTWSSSANQSIFVIAGSAANDTRITEA